MHSTILDVLTNAKHIVKRVLVAESRAIYGEDSIIAKSVEMYIQPIARMTIWQMEISIVIVLYVADR